MTMRRRPSHVRPRPPARDRVQTAIRSAPPRPDILRRYRPVPTRRRMPAAASLILIVAGICLGAGMLLVGSGIATRALAELGAAVGDAMSHIQIQSSGGPRPTSGGELNTPVFDAPANDGYTNQPKVTLAGSVPGMVTGKSGYSVRIYSVQDGKRLRYQDVVVGGTVRFSVPDVALRQGENTFVATLVAPTGESAESQPVAYTLDTTAPKFSGLKPANNASVTAATVNVSGRTEPNASIAVTNGQAPGTGDAAAGADGTFQVTVALAAGDNTLTISATDKAGNKGTATLRVHRSLGKLAAFLSANPNRITAHTDTKLVLTVRATASDGSPLANASVVFSVAISGVGPIQSPTLKTNSLGQVSWTTTIQDATPGSGFATVVVTTDKDGDVNATTPITVVSH